MAQIPKRCHYCKALPDRISHLQNELIEGLFLKDGSYLHYPCYQKKISLGVNSAPASNGTNLISNDRILNSVPLSSTDFVTYKILGNQILIPENYNKLDPSNHHLTWSGLSNIVHSPEEKIVCASMYIEKLITGGYAGSMNELLEWLEMNDTMPILELTKIPLKIQTLKITKGVTKNALSVPFSVNSHQKNLGRLIDSFTKDEPPEDPSPRRFTESSQSENFSLTNPVKISIVFSNETKQKIIIPRSEYLVNNTSNATKGSTWKPQRFTPGLNKKT